MNSSVRFTGTIPSESFRTNPFLLLSEDKGGRVAMILPTEGKLRQIQTFSWSDEDLQARLNRLRQDTLARTNRMKDAVLSVIPLVGWAFYNNSGRRLGVYLTNTLDEALQKSESLFEEFIAEESDQAAEIKRYKPVMVVVGNPPYSVNSANKSEWVITLVRDAYYPKDEMKEQNPKMLLDDYVKFLRFGQWRIINNHGYLDNHIEKSWQVWGQNWLPCI
jgi:hypothetical protein